MINSYKEEIKKVYFQNFKNRAKYFRGVYSSFKLPEQLSKTKYLDVGCGMGYNALEFSQGFRKIYALEYNKKDLEKSKKNIKDKRFSFVHGDVQNIKFKNETFDLITIFSVIEHVPNTAKAVTELSRVLKKEGRLLIQLPNRYFFVELHTYLPFLYLIPESFRNKLIKKLGYSDDAFIACKLSKSQLIKELKKNEFKFKIKKMIYPESLFPKRFVWAYKLLRTLGIFSLAPFGYFIVCQKGDKK